MSALSLSTDNYSVIAADGWQIAALKAASYLTDPICKIRESYFSLYLASGPDQIKQIIALLVLGIFANALLAPFTAPLGALLRAIVVFSCPEGFLFIEKAQGPFFQNKELTLLSYNVCFMPGGYAQTDGGVKPPSQDNNERIRANIGLIQEYDPDILCLYEVPDICDAAFLSQSLPQYPFLIPVAGPKAVGPSSMMYIASKYKIAPESISFTSFLKGTELTGRAAHSEKGFLSFELESQNTPAVSIISTHLQHSEVPGTPEDSEIEARRLQMCRIAQKILGLQAEGKLIILTGDLNQEERELPSFLQKELRLHRDEAVIGLPTWGGEGWSAELMDKPHSEPLTLDYTFVSEEASIHTEIIDVGFDRNQFNPKALSDHKALFSKIRLPR